MATPRRVFLALLASTLFAIASGDVRASVRYDLLPLPLSSDGTEPDGPSVLTGFVITDGTLGDLSSGGVLGYEFRISGANAGVWDTSLFAFDNSLPFDASPRALRLQSGLNTLADDLVFCPAIFPSDCDGGISVLGSQAVSQHEARVGVKAITGLIDLSTFASSGVVSSFDAFGVVSDGRLFAINEGLAPGDFNADGSTDEHDLALWATAYGSAVLPGESADADFNGIVDAADYTIWRDDVIAASHAIPEPTAIFIVLAGILANCQTHRRR